MQTDSMYYVSLTYLHDGDWTINLNGVDRDSLELIYRYHKIFPLSGYDFEILETKCSSKREFNRLLHEISINSHIRRIAFTHRVPGKIRPRYRVGLLGDSQKSLYVLLEEKDAIVYRTRYYEGVEAWDFIIPREDILNSLCRELLNTGSILKLDSRKIGFDELECLILRPYNNLSRRELETVKQALQNGYFEWPRRVTLQDLAQEFRISKSTVNEYLRKAIRKILSNYLQSEGVS